MTLGIIVAAHLPLKHVGGGDGYMCEGGVYIFGLVKSYIIMLIVQA